MTVVMTVAVWVVLTEGAVVGVADFVAAIGEELSNLLAVQCRVDPQYQSCHARGSRTGTGSAAEQLGVSSIDRIGKPAAQIRSSNASGLGD
ncbi:hypothetical protein D3C78_1634360 [compost metagenome]